LFGALMSMNGLLRRCDFFGLAGIFVSLALSGTAWAQEPGEVTPGTRLRITTADRTLTGALVQATPSAVVIAEDRGPERTLQRTRITRMEMSLGRKDRLVLGLAIGVAVGAALGIASCEVGADPEKGESNIYNVDECSSTERVWVPIGMAVGGGALGAWGGHAWKHEVWKVLTIGPSLSLVVEPSPRHVAFGLRTLF